MLFLYCYFGNVLTFNLLQLGDTVYCSEWYNYPIDVQQYIVMILRRTQKPFIISALGMMPCTLENFQAVGDMCKNNHRY